MLLVGPAVVPKWEAGRNRGKLQCGSVLFTPVSCSSETLLIEEPVWSVGGALLPATPWEGLEMGLGKGESVMVKRENISNLWDKQVVVHVSTS